MVESDNNNTKKNPVIVLFAPTASGKTALTKEFFSPKGSHFILNAEIISADSQAVYRNMDIGTAKPTKEICQEIPHHLIDILNPNEQFNVSDFVDLTDIECEKILQKGKIPVVCGGSGFYIRSFLFGIPSTPVSDEKLRNELKERILKEGNLKLYEELKQIDKESAAKIHVNDAYRICRALEVYYLSGKTRTSYQIEQKFRDKYDFLFIVLEPERKVLYERIAQRVEEMFEQGLDAEVKFLLEKGYTKDTPGLKAIGYSEWLNFENPFTPENMQIIKDAVIHHSCKYAKKQYTYIRDIKGSKIIKYSGTNQNYEEIKLIIQNFLKTIK